MNAPVFVFIGLTISENIVNILVSTIIAEHCKIGTICRLNIKRIYIIEDSAKPDETKDQQADHCGHGEIHKEIAESSLTFND